MAHENKPVDNGIFQSRNSVALMPPDLSQTLFFNSTTFDYDAREPNEAEGLQTNMLRIHETGRKDCKFVPPPFIKGLTRKSQTYTLSYRPKQATDLEVNKFALELKKMGTTVGPPQKFSSTSSYQQVFRPSSPASMKRAKPTPLFTSAGSPPQNPKSMVTASHTQTIHGGENLKGFKATGAKALPVHELEVQHGIPPDYWKARSHYDYTDYRGDVKVSGTSVPWRKKHGRKMVDTFLNDFGQTLQRASTAPDPLKRKVAKPIMFVGTDSWYEQDM